MDQPDLELQLKAWKQLAVGKQMLIRVATDGLGLDPDCSSDDLKQALVIAIKQSVTAGAEVAEAKEGARVAVSEMERKMLECERARTAAEAAKVAALSAKEVAEQRIAAGREANARDLKKVTAQLAEKQKALKAINVALADTPENVVRKLKGLRKEKFDEANARKRAEGEVGSLRKKKQALEKSAAEAKTALEQGAKLVEQYRSLVELCGSLHEQLEPLVGDGESLPALPEVDEELLASIEQATSQEDK
jgi:hypothetical protein